MSIPGIGPLIRMERYLHVYSIRDVLSLFSLSLSGWQGTQLPTFRSMYLNPSLIDLIKTAFFNGPMAFGYKFKKHYVTSHPDHKEPELTIPVVTLSVMAVSNAFNYNLTITDATTIQVFCGLV